MGSPREVQLAGPRVIDGLAARRLTIGVAEGDTGGVLLEMLTAVPGSSAVVRGGVVAYHDDLKRGLLGVDPRLLSEFGAVSGQVAEAMAEGVRRLTGSDIGVATTGIAGPSGATPTKPVGLAYVAAVFGDKRMVREHRWHGDRSTNRRASAEAAIALVKELLKLG